MNRNAFKEKKIVDFYKCVFCGSEIIRLTSAAGGAPVEKRAWEVGR